MNKIKLSKLSTYEHFNPLGIGVVIVDMQNDFCAEGGVAWKYAENKDAFLLASNKIKDLVQRAKELNFPCFFVRSFMDEKYKLPSLIQKHKDLNIHDILCKEGTWGSEFYKIEPQSNDLIITKHTSDSFLYTFLEPLLHKYRVSSIILAGFLTEICVLETGRSAIQRGFNVLVPRDCTAGLYQNCKNTALDELEARNARIHDYENLLHSLLTIRKKIEVQKLSNTKEKISPEQLYLDFEIFSETVKEKYAPSDENLHEKG